MNGFELFMTEVKSSPLIIDDLNLIINNDDEWVKYFNFDAKPVSADVMRKDPFLKWLGTRYNFIGGVLKVPAFTEYSWHTDTNRGAGINILLQHSNSVVMFTENEDLLVKDIVPMSYKLNRFYLFNTQIPHSVINFNGNRYLFTIEFDKDKDSLSYEDLYNDVVINYNEDSYAT